MLSLGKQMKRPGAYRAASGTRSNFLKADLVRQFPSPPWHTFAQKQVVVNYQQIGHSNLHQVHHFQGGDWKQNCQP